MTGRLESAAFAAAVSQVVVAAGRDETLPVLTGVRTEIAGERLILAATDRYRLAVRETSLAAGGRGGHGPALIPSRTLNETAERCRRCRRRSGHRSRRGVHRWGALAGFAGGARRTTTRLVEGQFPDYRRLLPASCPLEAFDRGRHSGRSREAGPPRRGRHVPVRLHLSARRDCGLEAGSQAGGAGPRGSADRLRRARPDRSRSITATCSTGCRQSSPTRSAVGFASADDPDESARKPVILQGKVGDGADTDYRYLLMPVRLPA